MKIVQINSVPNGSTGKIMFSIHNEIKKNGDESYVVWGRGRKSNNSNEIFMNDDIGVRLHFLYNRITGKNGFASKRATIKLINKLKKINPDIIHLHNIHGYYINLKILFNYLKTNNIKIIWTLHDCWAFTGQCPHFLIKKCNKWKTKCYKCPMISEYPKTFFDNSTWNYQEKKKLFLGLDMILITPSKWLGNMIKQSFLKDYPINIINNGIDLDVFTPEKQGFREKYNLNNKIIILGISSVWDKRKGLNDFIRLSKILDDKYQIVLIGLTKKQIKKIPNNIIGITKTENQKELSGIYAESDILFNPTYEDNYPTINIESIACGTPVLTYDTGGSPEFINFLKNKDIKYVIAKSKIKNDMNIVKNYIDNILKSKIEIINRSDLDEKTMANKYIKLYKRLLHNL